MDTEFGRSTGKMKQKRNGKKYNKTQRLVTKQHIT